MRILVCGSRHLSDDKLIWGILDQEDITFLISGAASGVDTLAELWAIKKGIPLKVYMAQWEKHGKAAGPIRNKQMLDEGKPDMVIAFLAPNSRGTKNMIEQATKAGVPVKVINI